ncbi:hypothetical protein ACE939_00880 [Aquimarina sp. W85]|uniref:hypothetical protein n=1 Tax=Aquimarina rhodophyticola TaxID=3342246 RepID=UPI00366E3C50
MSRRPKIKKGADSLKKLFANWLSQLISMIAPQHLVAILGRGTGKTTDIIAKRLIDICYDMPGCYIAISSDTYMNALKNVLPSIIEGWKRNGWIEGIHFVVGTRPPKKFYPKGYTGPYKPPISWKHTITVFTGTHFKLISQDRPSTGAGDSYQHIVGDEIKYQAEKKINKLTPALRGEFVRFGHSPYYMGTTFTSDMPNPNHGEHDWILKRKENMDPKQIKTIIYCADIVNTLNIEKVNAQENNDFIEVKRINKNLARWEARLKKARRGSTFFYIGSSFVNIDILRPEYFYTILKTMNFREVMVAIFSILPKLEKGQMFYPNLSRTNFYANGYNYTRYSRSKDGKDVDRSSLDLKYVNHHEHLEGGLDTGKMCSLVIGQPESAEIYRVLKEFYTLPPEFLPALGKKFREFFKDHRNKHFKLYHDRAANKMQSVGEDHASKIKEAIEWDVNKIATGWTVELMSRNQGTIYQQTEYELMLEMLIKNNNKDLPLLLIDRAECSVLKGSMEQAKVIVKQNKEGQKTIHKDKSSEKTDNEELLLASTNMSDGLKYLVCRPEWLEKLEGNSLLFSPSADPGIH